MMTADIDPKQLSIVYDGECPFCANFVKFYAARKNVDIKLINAREKPGLVQKLRSKDMEINDGMVVIWQGHYYYGAKGMHLLSILSTESGVLGTLNRFLLRNKNVAGVIYPVLAAGRKLTLSLLRRKLIPHP